MHDKLTTCDRCGKRTCFVKWIPALGLIVCKDCYEKTLAEK